MIHATDVGYRVTQTHGNTGTQHGYNHGGLAGCEVFPRQYLDRVSVKVAIKIPVGNGQYRQC